LRRGCAAWIWGNTRPHPDPAKAEDSFRTALAIAREQGRQGELLAPVYGSFTEGFDTADLKEAAKLLSELA
jgi:predicted ATPase